MAPLSSGSSCLSADQCVVPVSLVICLLLRQAYDEGVDVLLGQSSGEHYLLIDRFLYLFFSLIDLEKSLTAELLTPCSCALPDLSLVESFRSDVEDLVTN